MSSKNTSKKSNGATSAAVKTGKKTTVNKAGKVTGVTNQEILELNEPSETDNNGAVTETSNVTVEAPLKKSTQTKKAAQEKKAVAITPAKKKAVVASKPTATNSKKIKLAASCYHYYRNWLKDFMRSHGVPSARFQKSPDSYDGHITVLESEKVKGLKALETWNKENPDTKEIFWDIKK